MVFSAALTGITAASNELGVIGNNISNASTAGFKSSRAEFADIYTATGGSNPIGSGVQVNNIRQVHSQGGINFTQSSLDLAISGEGYFNLGGGGTGVYTRAGSFTLDREGYIVNSAEQRLQGLSADANGNISPVTGDIRIDTSSAPPNATTEVSLGVNLDSGTAATTSQFVGGNSPADTTFSNLSSTTIYDSLGNAHVLTTYYIKADEAAAAPAPVAGNINQWYLGFQIDGQDLYDPTAIGATNSGSLPVVNFNTDGTFNSVSTPVAAGTAFPAAANPGTITQRTGTNLFQLDFPLSNGASALSFSLNFNNQTMGSTTQFGSSFAIQASDQNGYSTGRIEDIELDSSGTIFGRFSNGQSRALGQVQLAKFANPEGLRPSGDTAWSESSASGAPTIGAAGTGSLGIINSGALEQSNVDITSELVALITAQRNFQANAQTIRTADTVTQTIINLR